jgi:nickel superoxide dismutase
LWRKLGRRDVRHQQLTAKGATPMVYRLLEGLDRLFGVEKARAHCDIPCGIYDPIGAQIAALTVIRMIDLMQDLEKKSADKDLAFHNSTSRYVTVKEEHAAKVKEETRIIWGDYMKPEHVEKYPQLHGMVHKIMKLASAAKQTANRDQAVELLEAVNEFAAIFWQTKNVATKRAKAPYPPALEVVYPAL